MKQGRKYWKMEESSSTTSRKRLKKNFVGGFGNYCYMPGCKSFTTKIERRLKYLYL